MSTYPPDLERYVADKIASGQFRSRDEFATEAARLYRDIETRHEQLKSDIRAALDESRQGESTLLDIEAIAQELSREFDEQA